MALGFLDQLQILSVLTNKIARAFNSSFFLTSSMVLGLLNQLQIFTQLYLIELLGLLTSVGLLELWHLTYRRPLTGFHMLVYFVNLSLKEFQARYLASGVEITAGCQQKPTEEIS